MGPRAALALGNDFLTFLKHFEIYTRPYFESKVVLPLDNHVTHLSLEGIEYCRANDWITVLSAPWQDTSTQLGIAAWWEILEKPWPFMTYQVLWQHCSSAATLSNIRASFRCIGVWPFNPSIFSQRDFSPAYVADRPGPSAIVEPAPPALDEPAPTPSLISASPFPPSAEAQDDDFSLLDLERSREGEEKICPQLHPCETSLGWGIGKANAKSKKESYLYRQSLPSLPSREVVLLMQRSRSASSSPRLWWGLGSPAQVKFWCSVRRVDTWSMHRGRQHLYLPHL